ncbi:acetate--CoA ligase family protein [Paracoccus sp. P2]|uniref:acetate--CoA ligase family protein n=1 Tax=Paracoccus sp. P2 TaxID=3248840 RepID=UPI00391F13F4
MTRDLYRLIFAPESIVIVGASADPSKTSSRPLRYLVEGGYKGRIYPINPRAEEIAGVKCWASLADLPEAPDLAFILLSADAAIDAVAECGRAGVGAAMILASGFGESGADGHAREQRLAEVARASGVRILGPSCLGLANLHQGMILTGNAAFAEKGLVTGGVFCASQSGSMIGALLSRGRSKGVNFAGLISVGGELDLSLGALCEATLDDPAITSYMLFLETIRDAPAIRRFAVGAAERGKPVVALKLGRSSAAAELTTSHTGGLAGEDDVADAFLADCGIVRVETLEALLEAGALARRVPAKVRPVPTVGVVTTTGGGAALVVDQLGMRGVNVEGPNEATLEAIRATGVDVGAGRIADLTLAGTRYDTMKAGLEAMLASPQYDLVVTVVGSSARFQPEVAVKPIVDIGSGDGRLATFIVPEAPEALAMLAAAGIPAFRTPEACADSVAAVLRRRAPRALDLPAKISGPITILDEIEGYDLLKGLGIANAPARAIPLGDEADPALLPAAVKIVGRDMAHKTDVGGVVLGVKTAEDFHDAVSRIRDSLAAKAPDFPLTRVVQQRMALGAVGEVLLGYRVDPQVGPMVLVAAGGVMTEILQDRAIRMAPVDLETAHRMLGELRSLPLLTGFRGKAAGDLDAVASAIVALSQLVLNPQVDELEINPLMVMPEGQGALAVDVVARLHNI